ncbi:hypothetical protein [Salipiger aestuarii]|uniref:hypothetical protein n=1 Tax=Salipiger aestuarii TaxID=568098 RepID=UPI0011B94178|nr:hypothetical protein [Salipiger aestuarii]
MTIISQGPKKLPFRAVFSTEGCFWIKPISFTFHFQHIYLLEIIPTPELISNSAASHGSHGEATQRSRCATIAECPARTIPYPRRHDPHLACLLENTTRAGIIPVRVTSLQSAAPKTREQA